MSKHSKSNPSLFRLLSEPFENLDAANKAIAAFLDELGDLREKHKIPNVVTIIGASAWTKGDGDEQQETEFLVPHMYGDSLRMESMAAYAYGVAASARQEAIGAMQTGVLKKRSPDYNFRT
jgi:hypothetical protein